MKGVCGSVLIVLAMCTFVALYPEWGTVPAKGFIKALQLIKTNQQWVSQALVVSFSATASITFLNFSREAGYLAIIASHVATAIAIAMKKAFEGPRPFWEDSYIQGVGCPQDFGTPSSQAASASAALLVLCIYGPTNKAIVRAGVAMGGLITIVVVLAWTGTEYFLQTLFGIVIAQCLAILVTNKEVKEAVYLTRESTYVAGLSVASLVLLYVGVGLLSGLVPTTYTEEWNENFTKSCSGALSNGSAALASLTEASEILFLAGFIIGYRSLLPKRLPPRTIKPMMFSLIVVSGLFVFMEFVDSIILSVIPNYFNLVVLGVHKATCGLILAFILPQLLESSEGRFLIPATELASVTDLT